MLAAAPRVPYHEEKETTMIGIRLADRSVFPVFEDERPGKRRVLLSTSRERQSCVEIPIVRSQSALDAEAAPVTIGTVRLEDLAELPRNEQEIELTVGLGSNGTLSVAATDRGSGNIESISINLAQATAEAAYVVPESLTSLPETATVSRRRLWPVIIILLVLIVLFGGALWLAFGGAACLHLQIASFPARKRTRDGPGLQGTSPKPLRQQEEGLVVPLRGFPNQLPIPLSEHGLHKSLCHFLTVHPRHGDGYSL
jgi:hypothetical protein